MATFPHPRTPGELHGEPARHELHTPKLRAWRWLLPLLLALLALWGLFGRRDHRPNIDSDAREPARMPYRQ